MFQGESVLMRVTGEYVLMRVTGEHVLMRVTVYLKRIGQDLPMNLRMLTLFIACDVTGL